MSPKCLKMCSMTIIWLLPEPADRSVTLGTYHDEFWPMRVRTFPSSQVHLYKGVHIHMYFLYIHPFISIAFNMYNVLPRLFNIVNLPSKFICLLASFHCLLANFTLGMACSCQRTGAATESHQAKVVPRCQRNLPMVHLRWIKASSIGGLATWEPTW